MSGTHRCVARAVKVSELDAHFQVMCEAFGLDSDRARAIYYGDPFFELSHKRILFDDGKPVSGLTLVPATLRLAGGAAIDIAGIAGVGTPPSRRNCGFAGSLLTTTLRDVPGELGYSIFGLVTDRPDYYSRFGWAVCSNMFQWTIPPGRLPRHAAASEVVEMSANEYDAARTEMRNLLESVNKGAPGTFVRDERRWRCIETLSPGRRVAAWIRNRKVEAYVAFDLADEADRRMLSVHELVAATQTGAEALVGFLAGYPCVDYVRGLINGTGLHRFALDKAPGITIKPESGILLRIASLQRCLTAVALTGFCPDLLAAERHGLSIRVDDATIPSHQHVRVLSSVSTDGSRRATVETTDNVEPPWIAGPIEALTQMFAGYRTPSELHAACDLLASGPDAIALAGGLFPKVDVFLSPPDMF